MFRSSVNELWDCLSNADALFMSSMYLEYLDKVDYDSVKENFSLVTSEVIWVSWSRVVVSGLGIVVYWRVITEGRAMVFTNVWILGVI